MNKIKTLKYLNLLLALQISTQLLTGIFADELPYKLFEIIHKGNGILLFLAVVIHVFLNWSWVKTTYLKKR